MQDVGAQQTKKQKSEEELIEDVSSTIGYATDILSPFAQKAAESAIRNAPRPSNIGVGIWAKQVDADVAYMQKGFEYFGYGVTSVFTVLNTGMGIEENIRNGESTSEIVSDAVIDVGDGAVSIATALILAKVGTALSPGIGTAIGLGIGLAYDLLVDPLLDKAFN